MYIFKYAVIVQLVSTTMLSRAKVAKDFFDVLQWKQKYSVAKVSLQA